MTQVPRTAAPGDGCQLLLSPALCERMYVVTSNAGFRSLKPFQGQDN